MHGEMVGEQFLLMRLHNSETFGGGTVVMQNAAGMSFFFCDFASTSHWHTRSPVVVETPETGDF